jgi:ribose 5-phosphate isomerase B
MSTIFLGADHAGFLFKNTLKDALHVLGYIVEDLGAHELVSHDDYPEYASKVAHAVMTHPGSVGVLLCGSAEGMCMAANKFEKIRAGVGFSKEAARLMRTDDDANVICIPTRISLADDKIEIVKMFLEMPFSGEERHKRRIGKIE